METEKALVRGLFMGCIISFPICFLVLVFATGNVIVSFFAIASIGSI